MTENSKPKKKFTWVELLIVIVVLAIIVVASLPQLLGVKSGAPWLPKTPPKESDRVTHPQGFSIIPPPGWVVKISDSETSLEGLCIAMSPGSKGMRYAPGLHVKILDSTPNVAQFREITFSNMRAYERTVPVGDAERPCLRYELIVTNNTQWYEVKYYSQRFRDQSLETPKGMMLYIHSFKPSP